MPTTPGGRWSPDDNDDWDLTVDLAAMQVSNEAATSSEISLIPPSASFTGPDSDRINLTPPELRDGISWYSTNTKRRWAREGGQWVSADGGLYLVQPASIVGGTFVDTRVSFSGATSVSLNGVFSSRFRNYKILANFTHSTLGAGVSARMRAGGVDLSGASDYGNARVYLSGISAVSGSYTSTSAWNPAGAAGNTFQLSADIFSPGVSGVVTRATGTCSTTGSSGVGGGSSPTNWSGFLGANTNAFDGITFSMGAGAMTGEIQVYGYA